MRRFHLEHDSGQKIASDALNTIGIKSITIEKIRFSSLWSAYHRSKRLLDAEGSNVDADYRKLFAAYDLISGHIKAACSNMYEDARLARF